MDSMEPVGRTGHERDALARLRQRLVDVGTAVGAYRLLHPIGSGATGEVWLAHDPRLDRRVAIKLLQPHVDGDPARTRLVREARAIAQIVHPNVVAIYDTGTIAGTERDTTRSFIAMELVDGCSLAKWLTEAPRTPGEILAVFVAAGQGLEAAHRAGQIHRDFKPSNVMIGARGEVKVLDFGLAKREGESRSHDTEPSAHPSSGDERLTETGVVMGTPRYMSPEQHTGRDVTAATDQFSFCCALLEALQGAPPFRGHDTAALCRAKLRARIEHGPKDVAPRLRAVLERGLDPRPEQRFQSIAALLAALATRRPVRARLASFATMAGLAALVSVGANEARVPPSASAALVAVPALGGAELRARIELAAGRALLAHADPRAAERLEHALALAEATDDALLSAETAAALVAAAVRQPSGLERLPALLGRADAAIRRAGEPATVRGDYWSALATFHTKRGDFAQSLDAAEQAHAAFSAALAADDARVDAAAFNVGIALVNLHRFDEGAARLAEVVELRERSRGRTDRATIAALAILGVALVHAGELERAEARLRDAVARAESSEGDRHPELAFALGALADVAARRGRLDDARTSYRRALAIAERREGALGPEVATLAARLGEVERRAGALDDAHAHLAQAIAGHEHMLGHDHALVAEAYRMLAEVELLAADPRAARGHAREALAILEALAATPEQLALARTPLEQAERELARARSRPS